MSLADSIRHTASIARCVSESATKTNLEQLHPHHRKSDAPALLLLSRQPAHALLLSYAPASPEATSLN
jgi:hypothetical protein